MLVRLYTLAVVVVKLCLTSFEPGGFNLGMFGVRGYYFNLGGLCYRVIIRIRKISIYFTLYEENVGYKNRLNAIYIDYHSETSVKEIIFVDLFSSVEFIFL